MKRLILLALVFLLLILPVHATENNEFFNLHASECVYDGRVYLLNDPNGYAAIMDAPGGKVQDYFFNEQNVTVYGVYTDSTQVQWAQLRYTPLDRGIVRSEIEGRYIGWVPFSSLYRDSDASDFLTFHEDEFVNRPLRFRLSEFPHTLLWPYPGASEPCGYLRWFVDDPDSLLSFPSWWQDSEGMRWVLWDNFFVCLDSPESPAGSSLPQNLVFYPSVTPDRLPMVLETPEVPERMNPLPFYLIGASLVLMSVAMFIRKTTNIERK